MADQVEVPKLVQYALVGGEDDEAAVTKLVMYVLAMPDDNAVDDGRQGHVHTQIFRRR